MWRATIWASVLHCKDTGMKSARGGNASNRCTGLPVRWQLSWYRGERFWERGRTDRVVRVLYLEKPCAGAQRGCVCDHIGARGVHAFLATVWQMILARASSRETEPLWVEIRRSGENSVLTQCFVREGHRVSSADDKSDDDRTMVGGCNVENTPSDRLKLIGNEHIVDTTRVSGSRQDGADCRGSVAEAGCLELCEFRALRLGIEIATEDKWAYWLKKSKEFLYLG